ncbi:MAG: class I fructose-bisphosphate aldolase [Chitinispirillaceae bacterium]
MEQRYNTLTATASALTAEGKGILAADESTGTITKRFQKINVDSTPETRREYRRMLFSASDLEHFISGVILFDETIRQKTEEGKALTAFLTDRGIIPGIKVDKGTKPLPFFSGEMVTEGLDGLRERLVEYRSLGARFAKWRAVLSISDKTPSDLCIKANAEALARYAALCQENEIVPIVEPEVLMDGNHDISACERATEKTLGILFEILREHKVFFEGLILKPNMVVPGKNSTVQSNAEEVANATIRTLRRTVPAAVPGIAFLSGGQESVHATRHLNAMNRMVGNPWKLTFSFSRALQQQPMDIWKGRRENEPEAQSVFVHRARCNSAASSGSYIDSMENEFSS